jgi:hypothetical protein
MRRRRDNAMAKIKIKKQKDKQWSTEYYIEN